MFSAFFAAGLVGGPEAAAAPGRARDGAAGAGASASDPPYTNFSAPLIAGLSSEPPLRRASRRGEAAAEPPAPAEERSRRERASEWGQIAAVAVIPPSASAAPPAIGPEHILDHAGREHAVLSPSFGAISPKTASSFSERAQDAGVAAAVAYAAKAPPAGSGLAPGGIPPRRTDEIHTAPEDGHGGGRAIAAAATGARPAPMAASDRDPALSDVALQADPEAKPRQFAERKESLFSAPSPGDPLAGDARSAAALDGRAGAEAMRLESARMPPAAATEVPSRPAADAAGAPTPAFRVALVPGPETGRFELRMDPPDLGAVTLSFYRDEDGVQRAAVTAENRDTLDLLRRHADVLLRELARAGAGDVELGFEDRRDGARFFHSPNDRRAGRPAEDADAFVLDVARADLFSDFHGIDRFA